MHTCAITASEIAKSPINCGNKGAVIDESTNDILDLKKRLRNTIESFIWAGYTDFMTSATRGIELWAAEAVLDFQEEYPGITLEIVVPYKGHSDKWDEDAKVRYDEVLARATTVKRLGYSSNKGAMFGRNQYILDHCSTLVAAYYEGSLTESLVKKARWNGKQIARLPFIREAA